jgi:hypothetical protein
MTSLPTYNELITNDYQNLIQDYDVHDDEMLAPLVMTIVLSSLFRYHDNQMMDDVYNNRIMRYQQPRRYRHQYLHMLILISMMLLMMMMMNHWLQMVMNVLNNQPHQMQYDHQLHLLMTIHVMGYHHHAICSKKDHA